MTNSPSPIETLRVARAGLLDDARASAIARQHAAGKLSARERIAVLADPGVRDCVEATAQAHGVPVIPAPDDALEAAARRAAVIRGAVSQVMALAGALAGQAGTKSSA
jgi:propionyl-CoA carboxylase beta chain